MPAADTAKLIAELTLKDNLSKGVRTATTSLGKLDKATSRTQKSLGTLGANLGKAAVVGAAAAAGGLVAVINSARDFESAFAGVRKTVDATEPEFIALSDAIRQMAKEIPIGAAELAVLGETAGALGIEGTKNIEEFIRVTALLGITTDLTAQDAATSLGIISNVLHLTSAEYSAFASSLVALGNAGASTESQIIEIAQRAGAAGELIGLTTEQVLGFSSAIASLGIESEAGGTALQKFLIETSTFAAEAGEELDLMAKVAGTSARQFKKVFDKDAGAALQRFLANLGKLSEGEQLAVLKDLGFNEARLSRTLLGLANNQELVSEQMEIANSAYKENTALTKEAAERTKTFDSQLQITKNVLNDIGITIGSKLLPKLTPLLQKLNAFVSENQGKIEEFGTKLATGFEEFADAVGKVDWQPFIDGLTITGDIAKEAIGLFMSLPPDVQKIAIAALAVNKVTGGLGSSIIKDLAGLALGSLKTITAAHVTVVGASVTGGPGGVGGVGKGGGALGTAFNVVIPLAAAMVIGDAIIQASGGPSGGTGNKIPGTPLVVGVSQAAIARGAEAPGPALKKVLGGPLNTLVDTAQQTLRSSERLEQITGTNAVARDAARLQVAATERAEANQTATLAARLADGTRSETAHIRMASQAAMSDNARAEGTAIRNAITAAQASRTAGQVAAAAIRDKDMSYSTTVNVSTSVSVRDQVAAITTYRVLNKVGVA